MSHPIFLVGGGKGGVGKSMLSMALLDHLRDEESSPMLIETDTSAPDVWKAYKDDVESQCIDLEQRDGWLELLDVLDRHADTPIVINSKAANQVGLRKFGGMLVEAVPLADGLVGAELQINWPKPTRPGMELRVFSEVVDIMPSRSKPHMAMVTMRNETRDQDDEVVQVFTVKMPVFKRPIV